MTQASDEAAASPRSTERLVVPDVLRGVAILAMLIAHAMPLLMITARPVRFVVGNISDLASPLFALVMGISAQIVLQRTSPDDRWRMLLQQAIRGLVLIALGVWMGSWLTWVAVVLAHLGILLILGVPILLLSTRWVIFVAIALTVVSEPITAWARSSLAPAVSGSPIAAEISSWLVFGDTYRVSNLLPFFLLGALLMRHGFRRDPYLWTMAVIAPIAYLIRPITERLTGAAETVSGTYADTLHDLGLVLAVYVVIVLLATVRSPGPRRAISIAFEPFRAIGAVALSLYVVHVGLIAIWVDVGLYMTGPDYVRWLILVPGLVVAGWLWWRFIGVGPLEWLLGWVTGRPKRWRRASKTDAAASGP